MVSIPDCPCFWFDLTLRFICVLAVPVVWTMTQSTTAPLLLPKPWSAGCPMQDRAVLDGVLEEG